MEKKSKVDILLVIIISVLCFSVSLIQYTFPGFLCINGVSPQNVLPFVVCVSMYFGDKLGMIFGLGFGMFLDGIIGNCVCYNSIFFLVVGYGVGLLVNNYLNVNFYSFLILSAVISMAYHLLFFLIKGNFVHILLNKYIFSGIYTFVYGIIIYFIVKCIHKLGSKYEV